jgi:dynein heavy chain 1
VYEFNESDIRCGLDTIDVWIDSIAMGRTNLPPSKVPFSAIFTLLSECVYGGKIDNSFDRRLLNTFLRQLFSVNSFESEFKLVVDDMLQLNMPDATKKEQFIEWIENLRHQQTPSWLGLPNSAEKVLLANNCREVINKLLKLSIMDEEEEELAYDSESVRKSELSEQLLNSNKQNADTRPAWMRQLNSSVSEWLNILPKTLTPIKRSQENIKCPLFRFFEREINTGIALLKTVLNDLHDVVLICEGNKKQTNYHRQIVKDLAKGLIPKTWKMRYTVPKDLIVQPWIVDFSERIKQMAAISKQFAEQGLDSLKSCVVWLGGLFTPEAYITATRQFVAQSHSWSLEELQLEITVYENRAQVSLDQCSFALTGLKLQGAICTNNKINLSTNIVNNFNVAVIKWTRISEASSAVTASKAKIINLPIYLNSTRAELLFTINMETEQNENQFYMRGVAILASSLAG